MDIKGFEGQIEVAPLPPSNTSGMAFVAVSARNRQALVDLLDKVITSQIKRGMEMSGFEITMPCGYSQRFTNNYDIPFDNVSCGCGERGRYLIIYQKE